MSALLQLLLLIIIPSSAFASGGPGLPMLTLNFVVFIAILFFLLRKPVAVIWADRITTLDADIRKGAIALEAAEADLQVIQDKYADLDKNIKELEEQIQGEAKQESDTVVKQANQQKLRIIEQAKKNIEREMDAQEKQIKGKFADQICSQAEEKLKAEFNSDFDRSYRKASLEAAGIEKLAGR